MAMVGVYHPEIYKVIWWDTFWVVSFEHNRICKVSIAGLRYINVRVSISPLGVPVLLIHTDLTKYMNTDIEVTQGLAYQRCNYLIGRYA